MGGRSECCYEQSKVIWPAVNLKILIAYDFEGREGHIEAPNFYRWCATSALRQLGMTVQYLPVLEDLAVVRLCRAVGIARSASRVIGALAWFVRHGRTFDLVFGWLGNGMIPCLVKAVLCWSRPRTCLVLYKTPIRRPSRAADIFKIALLRLASVGCDLLLTVDRTQASLFGRNLRRRPGTTESFCYGVDAEWYDRYVSDRKWRTEARTIFVPGSAGRDDDTLVAAIRHIEVTVHRFTLCENASYSVCEERSGGSTIVTTVNAPYVEYVARCLRSEFVVIPVLNQDTPFGLTALLECMALKKAVVISAGISTNDYVIDGVTAVLYPPGDVEGLRKRISELLDNRDLVERIGAAARASVKASCEQTVFALACRLRGVVVDHAKSSYAG